jgi:DNA polymerase
VKKPSSCEGCPLYQSGEGFVPDEVVEGAEVFVLAQNPGSDEEKQGKPMVGKTGQAMEAKYFPVAGLRRGENVSIGNTIRCRWKDSNNLPVGRMLANAVEHCTRAHLKIPASTKLVVAQGALAAKLVSGDPNLSIEKWRGFLIPCTLK